MSADELVVTIAAVAIGPVLWTFWVARLARAAPPRHGSGAVSALAMGLAACALFLFAVLKTIAASDVVNAPRYVFMYLVLGLAWLRISEWFFTFAGLSARDDVVERRNGAAIPALVGALAGVTFSYAGGNVGDGPGWWVVVFSAALATAMLFIAWLTLAHFGHGIDPLTIDRDPSAGVRLGAFLASTGLVLGRGVAGDWESAAQTVMDAAAAVPAVLAILAAAIVAERVARPTAQRPRAPMFALGLLPALVYFGIAAAALSAMGWPE